MNGPEHYAEAERLTALAEGKPLDRATALLAEAQVHATLADAAATAGAAPSRAAYDAWADVLGYGPAEPIDLT